jgi:hypothetical protein
LFIDASEFSAAHLKGKQWIEKKSDVKISSSSLFYPLLLVALSTYFLLFLAAATATPALTRMNQGRYAREVELREVFPTCMKREGSRGHGLRKRPRGKH